MMDPISIIKELTGYDTFIFCILGGSRLYRMDSNDSDYDYYIVIDDKYQKEPTVYFHQNNIDLISYQKSEFESRLRNNEILEVMLYLAPNRAKIIDHDFNFNYDREKMQEAYNNRKAIDDERIKKFIDKKRFDKVNKIKIYQKIMYDILKIIDNNPDVKVIDYDFSSYRVYK